MLIPSVIEKTESPSVLVSSIHLEVFLGKHSPHCAASPSHCGNCGHSTPCVTRNSTEDAAYKDTKEERRSPGLFPPLHLLCMCGFISPSCIHDYDEVALASFPEHQVIKKILLMSLWFPKDSHSPSSSGLSVWQDHFIFRLTSFQYWGSNCLENISN